MDEEKKDMQYNKLRWIKYYIKGYNMAGINFIVLGLRLDNTGVLNILTN